MLLTRSRSSRVRTSDLRWLPRLAWAYGLATVGVRCASLPRLLRQLDVKTTGVKPSPAKPEGGATAPGATEADRVAYLTNGILRRLHGRDFCLPRTLMLFHFLARWGYPARVLIGVRKDGDGLAGHAWLEVDGSPYAEAGDPRRYYHVTYSYPPTDEVRYEHL